LIQFTHLNLPLLYTIHDQINDISKSFQTTVLSHHIFVSLYFQKLQDIQESYFHIYNTAKQFDPAFRTIDEDVAFTKLQTLERVCEELKQRLKDEYKLQESVKRKISQFPQTSQTLSTAESGEFADLVNQHEERLRTLKTKLKETHQDMYKATTKEMETLQRQHFIRTEEELQKAKLREKEKFRENLMDSAEKTRATTEVFSQNIKNMSALSSALLQEIQNSREELVRIQKEEETVVLKNIMLQQQWRTVKEEVRFMIQ